MNHLNFNNVIVGYSDDFTVHLVREGNNCLVFTDAGKMEVVGQGLTLTETRHFKVTLAEISEDVKILNMQYPGCVIDAIPFKVMPKLLDLLIKMAKSPFATFHTRYLSETEEGRVALRKVIAGFSSSDYRKYKPVDGVRILNALRLYIIIGDYEGFCNVIKNIDEPEYHQMLDTTVYNGLVKRVIEIMYGKFEAPFNVDFATFPIEVGQPFPTTLIEQWVQENQLDMKAGVWSDSTQLN